MYGKLVHRPPFGHHYHAPRPPFGEPREVGERYLGHPELTDYWIKPYLLEALKHYPRLDDECVVEGLWTFANSILLKNYKAVKRVPPTFDDPEVTHKIAFLDREDVELGSIKFWRKVDSTFGIDVKLGSGGISIVGDNDNPTMSLVNTPVNDGPKEIVNVEYLNQALAPFNDALDALANRIQALENLYDDHISVIVTDPDGNYREVHTIIHANIDDANLPTCGAVYQYGKGISDALNERIDNLPGPTTVNNATTSSKGVMQVGSNLIVSSDGVVSVDTVDQVQDGNMHPVTSNAVADEITSLRAAINALGSSGGSYIFAYPSGSVDEGGDMPTPEIINAWDIITGNHIASAVTVSAFGGGNHPIVETYTINQNSSLDSNTFVGGYWANEAVYNPINLSGSDSYRCIVAPEITRGSGGGGGGDTRPWVRVKAGVFQRIV